MIQKLILLLTLICLATANTTLEIDAPVVTDVTVEETTGLEPIQDEVQNIETKDELKPIEPTTSEPITTVLEPVTVPEIEQPTQAPEQETASEPAEENKFIKFIKHTVHSIEEWFQQAK